MKKTILIAFLIAAIFAQKMRAQCPFGDVHLWHQADVDSFPIKHPNCHKIDGGLMIVENSFHPGPAVENLHALIGIDTVMGKLQIGLLKNLPNLSGLDSLRFVAGDFGLGTLKMLNSLAGLDNLRQIGGEFWVKNDPLLKNFHGLENLTQAGGIRIEEMGVESLQGFNNLRVTDDLVVSKTELKNMGGLEKLDSVKRQLYLGELPHLKSLHGLENLERVGLMTVWRLDSLPNLHGLEGLKSGEILEFSENKLLESLDGLENLKSLTGQFIPAFPLKLPDLFITKNPKLHDLSALDHPISIEIGLEIRDNPSLSACSVEAICTVLGQMPDTVTVFGNLQNCNSTTEILSFCTVATGGLSEKTAFEVFPNPISDGGPLQILLENEFFGTVKIEILNLDGRVLKTVFREKTVRNVVENIDEVQNLADVGGPFFVRVSDGKTSATRLIFRV